MPVFTLEQIRRILDEPDGIRSVSVIAPVNHGKSTVTDLLIRRAGISSAAGECPGTHTGEGSRTTPSTRSTGVSLYFELEEAGGPPRAHLVNLVDSPGNVDFSSEVAAALRITDGVLVVLDCIEGLTMQTETLLRHAVQERVRPCLFINQVDRCILELQMDPEDMFQRFCHAIEDMNTVIATYTFNDGLTGVSQVSPEKGTVVFGSGLHGWAFSIERFAAIYAVKMGVEREKMTKRLWGDSFFDGKRKVWTRVMQPEGAIEALPRAFCQFIVTPVAQFIRAIMNEDKTRYERMMAALGITLKGDDKKLTGTHLVKRAMEIWLNAADTLLSMIATKLPSPRQAQKYRVENLYQGPMDDAAASAIRSCDAAGPLMMYISKMVPFRDKDNGSSFYAFGRVFSGTIKTGQRARIQGPDYKVGGKEHLSVKHVQGTLVVMGHTLEQIADVPSGNIVALAGLDQCILKSCTITTLEDAHNIADLRHPAAPVVRVAIRPRDSKDLPKLIEGLQRLSRSDPLVLCTAEESGQHVLAGSSELHLEICLKDLREEYAQCDFMVSDPGVSYRETVQEPSSQVAMAKSPNKHSRFWFRAEPMPEALCLEIEGGRAGPKAEAQERTKLLCERFGWEEMQARKIWCWGPEREGANVLVDATVAVEYLSEIKEYTKSAFQWVTKEGPLCEENLRGIKFSIVDVTLNFDAIHRGAGQVMPPTRRACSAALMLGRPTLQEPVFLVEIISPEEAMTSVRACLRLRRGRILEENLRELPQFSGAALTKTNVQVQVKAHLPVAESFGFAAALRQQTSGLAYPQCVFDHWESMPGDAMEAGSKVQDLVLAVRQWKSLKVELPALHLDKL